MARVDQSHLELLRMCADHCRTTFNIHCLERGGQHLAPDHVRLMEDCINICDTAAAFVARGSQNHAVVCAACAEICRACADSCAAIDDKVMQRCAEHCRECADACERMAGGAHQSKAA